MLVGISVWCIVPNTNTIVKRNTISGNMNEGKGLFYFFLITDVFQRDKLLDIVFAVSLTNLSKFIELPLLPSRLHVTLLAGEPTEIY